MVRIRWFPGALVSVLKVGNTVGDGASRRAAEAQGTLKCVNRIQGLLERFELNSRERAGWDSEKQRKMLEERDGEFG